MKIYKLTKKQIYTISTILVIALILLLAMFIPSLFSKSYAQSKHSDVDKSKTIKVDKSFFDDLLSPEYVVFNITGNNEARANFVTLKRKYLIFWTVKEQKVQEFPSDAELTEEEQKNKANEGLDSLFNTIKDKGITSDDIKVETVDFGQTNDDALAAAENLTSPGAKLQELNDPSGKYKIETVVGLTPSSKMVKVNGVFIPELDNSASLAFDLDNKYLYYTKYQIQSVDEGRAEIPIHSGKIYRYNLATNSQEEVYSFGQEVTISLKANSEYIAYATNTNEIGTININSKEKKIFDNTQLGNITLSNEPEHMSFQIYDVSLENFILEYTNLEVNPTVQSYYRISLSSLQVQVE